MRRLANVVFFSSIFISVCAAALSLATGILLHLEIAWATAGFVFCGTLFIYNSHALYTNQQRAQLPDSERYRWVRQNRKWLLALSFLALAACCFLIETQSTGFFIWLAHLVVLAVAYTVPVVPGKEKLRNLRSIPLLKVILIAYVWAAVTVQLPLLHARVPLAETYSYFLLYGRFLFILALAPLFDIRDVERDKLANVITLPALIGHAAAKAVSVILLLVFSGLVFLHYNFWFALALACSAAAAILVVVSAKPGKSERFYSGWADGMMLLQAVLVYLAAMLSDT
ncbi:MAG: hypothetical protein EOP50_06210 [Sphingobacteriales bacterium]|nr:MAG: hypothetical protein EOP50_06210 [Sphingobacteriales bacterium]